MPSKIYINPEATTTWTDATGDLAMTLNNLASGAGRQGAQKDLGSAARPFWYEWRAFVEFATTPVIGERVDIFLKTSDGTHPDNDDGTGNIAVSNEAKLRNLQYIGSVLVDEAALTVEMVAAGVVQIAARYVNPVFWNRTADNLVASNNQSGFVLTPLPFEIQ